DNQRHDGGICNAQPSNAMYPQTGIHDRVATRAHSAGTDRMQVRDAAIADVLNELLVRADGGPRHHLFRDIWLERRLFGELSRQPNAADHGIDVMCGFHELELDPRRSERVAACEAHQPATFRTQVNGRHAEPRPFMGMHAGAVSGLDRPEIGIDLEIGTIEAGVRAGQDAGMRGDGCHRPISSNQVSGAGRKLLERRAMELVEGAGPGRAPGDIRIEVVVQVGADRSEVVRDLDTHLVQMATRSDAGQQQKLRRAVNATGDDHLALGPGDLHTTGRAELDANGAAVLDDDACRMRVRPDHQVPATSSRFQICGRGAPSAPLADRCLIVSGAFLPRAVEVAIARNAGLDGRFDDRINDFVLVVCVGYIERTTDAVELVLTPLLVFGLAEESQNAFVVPADTAELTPAIVVGRRPAHIDHAVKRTRPAEHFATRLVGGAPVEAGNGLTLEPPIVGFVCEEPVIADWNVYPWRAVAPARFEQEHPVATRLRKPRCHRTAGRPGAGHDVVVRFRLHLAPHRPAPLQTCFADTSEPCRVQVAVEGTK